MPIISETQVRTACAQQQAAHLELLPSLKASRVRMSVEEILAEIQQGADQPLDQAYTIPSEAYTSDAFYAWEMEEIFRKEWYCLLHVSQIPQVGDFVNLDLFGNPLVVVRDKSEDIQVLSRTCPHRAMDIMPPGFGYDGHGPAEPKEGKPGCGHTRLFICPYHSWTFDLDGKLKGCPEMQEAAGFRRDDWALTSFRSEVWNGFVFVNLDGKAPRSVAEQYRELGDDLGRWNSAEMELVMERDWEIPCNWKVLTENFMESYHHLGAHAKTLQPTMHAKDTWTEEEKAHYIRCHLPYKAATRAQMEKLEAQGEQAHTFPPIDGLTDEEHREWGLILGFPLFTLVTAPDQLVWYRIIPEGPDKVRLMTGMLVPKEVTQEEGFAAMLEQGAADSMAFHLEDMEVITAVQRSYYGDGYQRGRLSHLEMPIWLIQRYLAARARGTWPTEDRAPAPSQR